MIKRKEIESLYQEVSTLVFAHRLKEALAKLARLMEGMRIADFTLQYDNLDQTYHLLLEYAVRGVPDPQREKVFQSLKVGILELSDKVYQEALAETGMHLVALKRQIEKEKETAKEEAAKRFDTTTFDYELSRLLQDTDLIAPGISDGVQPHITPKLFQVIWLSDKYVDNDIRLINAVRTSGELPWYEKSLAVSALTLSLLNYFDKEKFDLLFGFYKQRENQVWQRALVGIVLAVYYWDTRIDLYEPVREKLDELAGQEQFVQDLQRVLLQIFKARETEKITRNFREEILPDVQRFETKLREKLDLDNILSTDMIEDKNPDWERIFEDSPDLLNKIEKMSEMQMEGLDLFMGSFAMLKHFDFFMEMSNWFRPFYRDNEAARASLGDLTDFKEAFLNNMESSYYICNSDKYSFCFNISRLPAEQSEKLMSVFNAEADNFRDMVTEEKILHRDAGEMVVITQYIQDLYRFFKLHPFRDDFRDIFDMPWELSGNVLFRLFSASDETCRKAGEFLFEKEHYPQVVPYFRHLVANWNPDQALIEKLGYCYQMMGQYETALGYFKQAELFDTNRLWSIKKIIYCYRQLKDYDSALHWCLEAEKLAADDVYVLTMTGNCYLDLKQVDQALEQYFKVEFMAPDNKKVMKPIAWCSLVLGKLEIARNYASAILAEDPTAHDYMHAGHVEYCLGNKLKAMEYYKASMSMGVISLPKFIEMLEADTEYLLANGMDFREIQFIADYLRYQ